MLPGATLVAGNPRLIRVVVVLRSCATDAADDLLVFFLLIFLFRSFLGIFLALAPLRGLRPVLKLIESFRVLAFGGAYRSTRFWFTGHIDRQ